MVAGPWFQLRILVPPDRNKSAEPWVRCKKYGQPDGTVDRKVAKMKSQNSSTLKQASLNRLENIQVVKMIAAIALGLGLVALAVVVVMLVFSADGTDAESATAAGLEASSARWSALGESYAPDYEAIADADSARYGALAERYVPDYERAAAANSARWTAMAVAVSEAEARTADAARWSAMAERYAPDYKSIAQTSSDRWSAVGELYRSKVEAGLDASAARWTAVGAWYLARGASSQ
jgi:hypothetical protein